LIFFFNSLTRKKEKFKPLKKGVVGMYTCGPTVYNFAHIGNLRTYIFEDILRRVLEYNCFSVKHVMNITDVGHLTSDRDTGEDKVEKAAKEQGKNAWQISEFYTKQFKKDIADLNINPPHIMPKATDHIKDQIELIRVLEKKGFTYRTTDGIYFDTSKFKNYGKFGNVDVKQLQEGARVEKNKEKRNITDFALWKFSPKGKKRQMEWTSPWGIGFPGWHIECSAMSVKYLKQPFDIHTGAIDHIPVHHQNEIAQSEAACGKPLANYWLHGEFLVIDKKRMGKSKGNFITLGNLKEKGYDPLAYRFFTFSAHYRTQLNFSWEAMEAAKNSLRHLYNQIRNLSGEVGQVNMEYKNKFLERINNDLNIPQALAVMQDLLKSNLINKDKLATILDFDKVFGLKFERTLFKEEVPEEIRRLIEKREELRKEKKWQEADEIRRKINKKGWTVEDALGGTKIIKNEK
jgi:cysteinyl-tRNA synthetase